MLISLKTSYIIHMIHTGNMLNVSDTHIKDIS